MHEHFWHTPTVRSCWSFGCILLLNQIYLTTLHRNCNCNCNWGTCIAPPTRRPRAHHRVNLYPGARTQNETEMWLNKQHKRQRKHITTTLVSFMNMYSVLHAFVISVTDYWVVLPLLLSLYCIDLFSCKAASVFIINLLTYLLNFNSP